MKKLSQMKRKEKTLKKLESKSEKIKVGDFVRCKASCESKYYITKSNVFLKVISFDSSIVYKQDALVEILHIDGKIKKDKQGGVGVVGEKYIVDLRNFKKVSEKEMQVYMV